MLDEECRVSCACCARRVSGVQVRVKGQEEVLGQREREQSASLKGARGCLEHTPGRDWFQRVIIFVFKGLTEQLREACAHGLLSQHLNSTDLLCYTAATVCS